VVVIEAIGEEPERAYSALDKVEQEVVGDSAIKWRDATGDFATRFVALNERLSYSRASLGNLLSQSDLGSRETDDGFAAFVSHVQVAKNGTYERRAYEPGVDPYPRSTTLLKVVTTGKGVILSTTLATVYADKSIAQMSQKMKYGKRIARHYPSRAVLSPERSTALVATTDNISELDRLEKAARKRFAKVTATLDQVAGLFEQLAEESFLPLRVERRDKAVVVTGRDAYNDRPLLLTATLKAGQLVLTRS